MEDTKYPTLLSPIKITPSITLKNRVIMGSMHIGLEDQPGGFSKLAKFYEERAKGGVALIITGGIAPNWLGKAHLKAAKLTNNKEVNQHKIITDAVHQAGSKIALQILHAGRYSFHPLAVSASNLKAPINKFKPWALWNCMVKNTIKDYIRCAKLAQDAGYDGVEIMGSEGYLINQFIAHRTNKRKDAWGGSYNNRIRFPIEIVKGIRKALGENFIIIYRLSMLDLVEDGSSFEEVIELAKKIELAGASIISSGIGWHEARIPTIATLVPRGAFVFVTQKVKEQITIPIVATNRINNPELAEAILKDNKADMVALARPLLADSDFVLKTSQNRSDEINTCIACNQACLDHIFEGKTASCLVNPRAGQETELIYSQTTKTKNIAVVGAGPAGLSFAKVAAQRGHNVTIFEAESEIGGQFNLAKQIPGKSEFNETLRYFSKELALLKVKINCNNRVSSDFLFSSITENIYDEIVLCSGIIPNTPQINGIEHPKVVSYIDVIKSRVNIGKKVAIIGAGGIGFDVAEFLSIPPNSVNETNDIKTFLNTWGIDYNLSHRSGLIKPDAISPYREIYLMQRKAGKLGKDLGKTTGWIHRLQLKNHKVKMISDIRYHKIDDKGLHYSHEHDNAITTLDVDNIVICAGQKSNNNLYNELIELVGPEHLLKIHILGGAKNSSKLDAKKAISDGAIFASKI